MMLPILALCLASCSPVQPIQAQQGRRQGLFEHTVQSGGRERTYALWAPSKLDGPAPLVIALHGLGGSGRQMVADNGWIDLANEKRFIVAGPNGLPGDRSERPGIRGNPRMWRTAGLGPKRIDDVQFLKDVIDDVASKHSVDRKRVYVVGHSNGGGMTYRFASEASELVAAIGTVASQQPQGLPKPKRAVPTIALMGTDDPLIPTQGGRSTLNRGRVTMAPASEFLNRWADLNGYPKPPKTTRDDSVARVQQYSPRFETWLLKGQGHGWPGKDYGVGDAILGPQLTTTDATAELWKFLSKHRLS